MKEMLVYRFEEIIYAPIDVVFSYVDDDEKIKKWNTMFVENIYEGEGVPKAQAGVKFTSVQKLDKKTISVESVITEYEAPHTIVIETQSKEGISITKYFLSREYDGTRLIVEASIIPSNFIYFLATKLFGKLSKFMMDEQMDNLKKYVEFEAQYS